MVVSTSTSPLLRLRLISSHLSPSSGRRLASSSCAPPRRPRRPLYSFTTACSFRGKPGSPVYEPDADASDKGKRSPFVEQGLPRTHPLARWRDAQLEKQPWGAGHDWFFVEGIPRDAQRQVEGEDPDGQSGESVTVRGTRGVVMGVADGVGGWEESGVDPSHFSQALMWFARQRVKSGEAFPSLSTAPNGQRLKEVLDGSFRDVLKEKAIVAGSSTACLVALDAETGRLHAANLGDSSFSILRPSPPTSSNPLPTPPSSPGSSPQDPAAPSPPAIPLPKYTLIHVEPSQTHFFNAPYQLSKLPPWQRNEASNSLMDSPLDAHATKVDGIQLKDGDVVVVSTDGFGDNVFGEELEQLCGLVHQKLLEDAAAAAAAVGSSNDASPSSTSALAVDPHVLSSSLAQTCLNFARLVMPKRDKVTPFEVEARKYGYGRELGGGKTDDCLVVVAVVSCQ
ncbi:hypothetical protein JCM10212_003646 [Sporobolomyces blumeae]